jgi:hypothetical protein
MNKNIFVAISAATFIAHIPYSRADYCPTPNSRVKVQVNGDAAFDKKTGQYNCPAAPSAEPAEPS